MTRIFEVIMIPLLTVLCLVFFFGFFLDVGQVTIKNEFMINQHDNWKKNKPKKRKKK